MELMLGAIVHEAKIAASASHSLQVERSLAQATHLRDRDLTDSALTSDRIGVELMAASGAPASLEGYDCRETGGCSGHISSKVFDGGDSRPPLQQKWALPWK